MGMTYEQYWDGDPWAVVAYRKADKIQMQRKNEYAWLQGMYFYEAICDAAPLLHPHPKRNTKAVPYSKKPYPLDGEEEKEKPQEDAEAERLKGILFFKNWARANQKNI